MSQRIQPATKVSGEILEMLNQAIARELAVSIQYIWQHVQAIGVKGTAVKGEFKKTAITEMKHAETIAERLFYLGGKPTTKPEPIIVGDSLEEFLVLDAKSEGDAIALYKKIIEQAEKEADHATAKIFRDILVQEEEHHDLFTTMLEEFEVAEGAEQSGKRGPELLKKAM